MRCAAIAFAAFTFIASSFAAHGASFEVAPTTLDLVPGKAGLLYITNSGDAPVIVQIQTLDWSQSGNADVLAPSETLFASPPLASLAPGERQIIRLLADPQKPDGESEYRLLVGELPAAPTQQTTVRVLLQFSIPVFVTKQTGKPQVQWSAAPGDDGYTIQARNTGDTAVKFSAVSASGGGTAGVPVVEKLTYLLPGSARSWSVHLPAAQTVAIAAKDERSGEALDADIAIAR